MDDTIGILSSSIAPRLSIWALRKIPGLVVIYKTTLTADYVGPSIRPSRCAKVMIPSR
jgi:hypothetical protein